MKRGPVRVAHLVSHPIPYFAPLYRELALRPEIDLTVFFYSDVTLGGWDDAGFGRRVAWDTPLLNGYSSKFLPSTRGRDISGKLFKNPNWDIVREIASGRYDVLWIHGYAHMTAWLAVAAARARGMRVLIREEQTLLHGRSPVRLIAKAIALRALFSQASALYIGEQNRRYFAHYGVPPARSYAAPYCVDNGYFRGRADALRLARATLRARFGISGDAPVVLFSGKLIEKKQPLLLIEAFARVRVERPCSLLIVGDGALRSKAEALVARLGVPDVYVAGFLNQSEIAEAYAAADLFVLPSKLHETWGLVVNEAMNFGLPIVVSDKVGCAADLVRPGANGFVVPHLNVARLAAAIETLVADGELRARFGARSREIVAGYSIEHAADGIVAGCIGAPAGAVAPRAASFEQIPLKEATHGR